ncbi:Bicoid-interacting protein 3-domain-containing protein [Ephemerocybe angulata]|uniref:RNA methyltransferase n=1 Tax=Ephemerocybe angulata TaxID=980116 RepID=A0A8H6HJV7_9AGAR|nr:Bicoid-interacting protein 3-domain-containing protein [Tulosesus angulatus]
MSNHIPIHGNYHGYYAKRPSPHLSDARLRLLPAGTFTNATVLDVGCNEGWVTCEIAQVYGAAKVVGVDIDESLVEAAWRRRRAVWSLQAPPTTTTLHPTEPQAAAEPNTSDSPPKKKRKRTHDADPVPDHPARAYFPASCLHEFGPQPVPPSSSSSSMQADGGNGRAKTAFPHNVSFRTADWTMKDIPEDKAGYDVVVAFSLTKWIHLHALDTGLTAFFQKLHRVLRPGGTLVLEPQPWESYTKARRMSPTLKENYSKLLLRPEGFGEVLREVGFAGPVRMGCGGEGGFERPVHVYTKL